MSSHIRTCYTLTDYILHTRLCVYMHTNFRYMSKVCKVLNKYTNCFLKWKHRLKKMNRCRKNWTVYHSGLVWFFNRITGEDRKWFDKHLLDAHQVSNMPKLEERRGLFLGIQESSQASSAGGTRDPWQTLEKGHSACLPDARLPLWSHTKEPQLATE